jgi:P-type Ca2+ transporter type 2C
MNWHTLDIEKIITLTGSSDKGLSSTSVLQKLQQHGRNELIEKKKTAPWLVFLHQFKDFMIVVLVAAAIISGIVGDRTDTIIILVIVSLNAVVGFIQEYRAEKAMDALKKMATPHTTVFRDAQVQTIDSGELVPGDIVFLESGNTVPADIRLCEAISLKIIESSLTGESLPVDKINSVITEENISLGDRFNMAYKGTEVGNGRGKGIVVATGMNTEIGRIAKMLQGADSITPLQQRMTDFGKKISYLILLICILLFVVGLLRGEDPLQMLLIAISLAVAAIPEALPALITIGLSMGARRLVKKNALVRRLSAVETLGSVSFICTDKTGTLTQNKMKVIKLVPSEIALTLNGKMPLLDLCMALNHNVQKEDEKLIGDSTEIAMVHYIKKNYSREIYDEVQQKFLREAELPFDADRKCMTTIHYYEQKFLVISKGAVEFITSHLKTANTKEIAAEAEQMASDGLRVLAFAYRQLDKLPIPFSYGAIENDLSFAGLVGMTDPPRVEAKAAVAECKSAGIRTVMITGDHKVTAMAIARQIGLIENKELVFSGDELSSLSTEEFEEKIENIRVYARVSPEQKLFIVKALQSKNHFVAMTGDGVNDAPALKKANIGIAMGITGTDVSKEAAHMILLDDNFATVVKAVKEGRRIYDNIRRFVKYILACNSAEIWTIFLAPLIGLPVPLLPVHILWINLVTDGLPGLALAAEKAEANIMNRPPRKADESLFAGGLGIHIVWVGLFMAFLTLGTQAWAIHEGNIHWQTMVFTVLSFAQLANAFAVRSDYEFIYKKGLFTNPFLTCAILLTFLLQLGVVYLPVANRILKTQPLTFTELALCVFISAVLFHMVELEKWIKLKYKENQTINS